MESYEVATRCWNCSRAWVGRSRRGVSPTAVCLSENTTMLDGFLQGWMDLFHLFADYTLVVATQILFDVHPYLGNDPI